MADFHGGSAKGEDFATCADSSKTRFNIVFLFEGTDNDPCKNPSAISELKYAYEWKCLDPNESHLEHEVWRRVLKSDQNLYRNRLVNDEDRRQLVYLVKGSGGHGRWRARIDGSDWDEIIGAQYDNLLQGIESAKRKLEESYRIECVNLYVFGFSRGAYQARLFLNGIVHFGIDKTRQEFVESVRRIKKCTQPEKHEGIPNIRYVGLIDTVRETWRPPKCWSEVGVPARVVRCRHAVALHEFRRRFQPQMLGESQRCPKVEERLFVGCHSDVGWAYNGENKKQSLRQKCGAYVCKTIRSIAHKFRTDGISGTPHFYTNEATRSCGRVVVAWLLDGCPELLMEQGCQIVNPLASLASCVLWAKYFPCLIHNSIYEDSNVCGIGRSKPRNMKSVKVHDSVRMIEGIWKLNCAAKYKSKDAVLKSLNVSPFEKRTGANSHSINDMQVAFGPETYAEIDNYLKSAGFIERTESEKNFDRMLRSI